MSFSAIAALKISTKRSHTLMYARAIVEIFALLSRKNPIKYDISVMTEKKAQAGVRKKAMDLLSRREHSEQELRQKLKSRDHDGVIIDEVLLGLKQDHLLSDARFTEAYVNHRYNAGVGPLKIRYELRQKGITDALADEFLEPLSDRWDQLMVQQRIRKFGKTIPDDYARRMKQARFLQNRGFSPESVMRLFR
jgi:regulatory protein